MNINKSNYEIYTIDYLDGKLSPSEVAEFMIFIADNPDIANEIELLRSVSPQNYDCEISPDFSNLKKELHSTPVNKKNFEEYCIAFYEKDLSPKAEADLQEWIRKNPLERNTFELYEKVILTPDTSIKFRKKEVLRKQKTLRFPSKQVSRIASLAAAACLAFFFVWNYPDKQETVSDPLIVDNIPTSKLKTSKIKSELPIKSETKVQASLLKEKTQIAKPSEPVSPELTEAAFNKDTNFVHEVHFARIESIEPAPIENHVPRATLPIRSHDLRELHPQKETEIISEIRDRGNFYLSKITGISVTDIIKTGIKGINNMAETDLKYEAITDENGKVTEFALSSETFNIRRKTRRN